MTEFEESRWPLVTLTLRGRYTMADATAHVVAFERFFRREEPFALAMVYADEAAATGEKEAGAGPLLARWLKANREALSEFCQGIAVVVPFPAAREAMGDGLEGVRRAFGCPVAIVPTPAEAEAWLSGRLGEPVPAGPTAAPIRAGTG